MQEKEDKLGSDIANKNIKDKTGFNMGKPCLAQASLTSLEQIQLWHQHVFQLISLETLARKVLTEIEEEEGNDQGVLILQQDDVEDHVAVREALTQRQL